MRSRSVRMTGNLAFPILFSDLFLGRKEQHPERKPAIVPPLSSRRLPGLWLPVLFEEGRHIVPHTVSARKVFAEGKVSGGSAKI